MKGNIRINQHRLLAVEGQDECNFFDALFRHENMPGIQLIDIGGKDKFETELPLLTNEEGFGGVHTLGFVRDAEVNKASSAFSSICGVLKKMGLPAPRGMNAVCQGVYDGRPLKTAVFIMPNNIDEGMLEDLCLRSVRDAPVYPCVDEYVTCCLNALPPGEQGINISKAKVQAYLSCKKPIVSSLGLGALKAYWNFDHPCFSDIKRFLHAMFD